MDVLIRDRAYTGPVRAVILDWAGTAVDYGCLGPTQVFREVFSAHGVPVTAEEARAFMDMRTINRLRAMTGLDSVAAKWREAHGRGPDERDVQTLYEMAEPRMLARIEERAALIPGLLEAVAQWRARGVRIGSTTGYTRSMMDVLAPAAAAQGYLPDSTICSSDAPAGRPYPWMCYQNAFNLEVYPLEAMVKIGDTVADVQEGRNAGMWTIALTMSGNELGLSRAVAEALDPVALQTHLDVIEARFRAAGAHFVARGIWETQALVEEIEARLAAGERP